MQPAFGVYPTRIRLQPVYLAEDGQDYDRIDLTLPYIARECIRQLQRECLPDRLIPPPYRDENGQVVPEEMKLRIFATSEHERPVVHEFRRGIAPARLGSIRLFVGRAEEGGAERLIEQPAYTVQLTEESTVEGVLEEIRRFYRDNEELVSDAFIALDNDENAGPNLYFRCVDSPDHDAVLRLEFAFREVGNNLREVGNNRFVDLLLSGPGLVFMSLLIVSALSITAYRGKVVQHLKLQAPPA